MSEQTDGGPVDAAAKVMEWKRRAERAEADRHPGCTCPSAGDAPAMHHDYCAAHYGFGGTRHYDCVPREQYERDTTFIRRQVDEQQDQAREQYDRADHVERERDGWRDLVRELMDDPEERGCPPVSDGWIHRPHEPDSDNTYCEQCGEAWPCPNERARAALSADAEDPDG